MRRGIVLVATALMAAGLSLETKPASAGDIIYYSAPPSSYMLPPMYYYPNEMVVAPGPIVTYQYSPPFVYAAPPVAYQVPVYRPRPVVLVRPRYYFYYGW